MEASFFYPALYYMKICTPLKIRVLPSGTLSETLDLENFVTARRLLQHVVKLSWTEVT